MFNRKYDPNAKIRPDVEKTIAEIDAKIAREGELRRKEAAEASALARADIIDLGHMHLKALKLLEDMDKFKKEHDASVAASTPKGRR